jgi:hypothetical protein
MFVEKVAPAAPTNIMRDRHSPRLARLQQG